MSFLPRFSAPKTCRILGTRPVVFAWRGQPARSFASVVDAPPQPPVTSTRSHKVVIVGGGSAGMTVSNQLLRSGRFTSDDIALIDPAEWHHYQPGWTLVGGGLRDKDSLKKKLTDMIDAKVRFYNDQVQGFSPDQHTLSLNNGTQISYDQLVVCPGIKVDFNSIRGLKDAVTDPHAPVSSIYSYETCNKTARNLADMSKGNAIFTHPAGPVKCAGAPQKIMWLALDGFKRAGLYKPDPTSPVHITFATAMPVMFGVPKYSKKLDKLRTQRGVEALFQHDLVAIEGNTAVFAQAGGKGEVKRAFDLLHVVPKMGPHSFVKTSALANEAGFVDVDEGTLRHKKYSNVWACGDASGVPTSKTAAAITAQAPVLVSNLLSAMQGQDQASPEIYDGYTSCPLVTEYGKVMLAEFGYGSKPHETFGRFVDQATPRRAFYYMKKDFFPWVYYASMVKGTWAGPKGWKW